MSLLKLRKQIDAIDHEWIALFKRRLEVAKQIARIKKRECIPIHDKEREKAMIEEGCRYARELEMSPEMITEVFRQVLAFTKQEMQRENKKSG